jgi:predicted metal-dependent hydrolase
MGDRRPRELVIDGNVVTVRIRESRRARTMRLIVGPRHPPEVVVPAGVREKTVDEFIAANRRWLAGKVAAMRETAARPRELFVERPGTIWLAGEPLPVSHHRAGRAVAALRDGQLVVGGAAAAAGAAIERWYRRECRRRLQVVAELEAARIGVGYQSIGVRDQRTRWGSCSRGGRLSFSWRLVLAPPEILAYVVVHELCHLREFNHSPSFWRLVESVRPDWRQQAAWLRLHGHELHEYQPSSGIGPGTAELSPDPPVG